MNWYLNVKLASAAQHVTTGTGNARQCDKCLLLEVSWMISFYL